VGEEVAARRKFIEENALDVKNLDVLESSVATDCTDQRAAFRPPFSIP
jgi:hypothetical protein